MGIHRADHIHHLADAHRGVQGENILTPCDVRRFPYGSLVFGWKWDSFGIGLFRLMDLNRERDAKNRKRYFFLPRILHVIEIFYYYFFRPFLNLKKK
jgi:hypothetical protein